jgi:DNA repair exonuclease SbcCD ATPase subunit
MIENLSKVLPQLIFIALAFAFIGWSIRGKANKPVPLKSTKPAPASDKGQQDRAKNLEAALEKSKAAHKALKSELETLQNSSVSKTTLESVTTELDAARKALDTETKRISTLETDLKKAQDTIRNLNGRANDADKAQKDRSFALENELSKTREQLAILQNRPDDSATLNAEIERLRESVAVSTRFAGEMRKREAAAVEALEKAEARLADLSDPSRPAPVSKKIGPVVDSGRIAAAKAEVIRLVEMNKRKELPVVAALAPVVAEVSTPEAEVTAPEAEETVAAEKAPPVKKAPISDELFALD